MDRIDSCFEKTKEFFEKEFKFDIKFPKEFSGVGNFSLRNVFKENNKLYVGEAAGLQDFFWGLGMRYAITSGFLAAKSIIHNRNYEKLAREKFRNKLRASVVNRYLFEKILDKNDSLIINNLNYLKEKSLFFL